MKITTSYNMYYRLLCLTLTAALLTPALRAQVSDTVYIDDVTVTGQHATMHSGYAVESKELINAGDLLRFACCNLGESFTASASVDVNYSDAATGARQIKLLGLSGTYVQMMQENVPAFRMAANQFGLGYVPGPWMQSIQISKGAASVRNGYESITGQIDIEYKKPDGEDGLYGNAYYDSHQKLDVNVDGSVHLSDNVSTGLLLHYEQSTRDHDGNGDGFMDMPKLRQYNLMDRWHWKVGRWMSRLVVRGIYEERNSGTSEHAAGSMADGTMTFTSMPKIFDIDLTTRHVESQWKNALALRTDRNESVALILKGVWHDADNEFGTAGYWVGQKNAYAQLLYDVDLAEEHSLSAGASLNHDYLSERFTAQTRCDDYTMNYATFGPTVEKSTETTPGVYVQYTYKHGETLMAMAGLRYDHSSRHGSFVTPRLNLKYHPADWFSLRLAAGKGYRTAHPYADSFTLLASGRQFYVEGGSSLDLKQEEAWNMGGSLTFDIPLGNETLNLNADYFYTNFVNQTVIDRDAPGYVCCYNLPDGGRSYSHVLQIDATYPIFSGFSLTAAWRWQDVKVSEWEGTTCEEKMQHTSARLRTPVLTSRYKALLTATYKTPLEFWQFDVTAQLNGPGRLPDCNNGEWATHYNAYEQLSAQVSRDFRHFTVYVGGENLTNFKQKYPIVFASDPYTRLFDATMVWGPTVGTMFYAGIRVNL